MSTEHGGYLDHFDVPPPTWKRPKGLPRIWSVIDGRRKTADGEIPKFTIQEVSEELADDVVDFMQNHFLWEDPVFVGLGIGNDPLALRELRTLWRCTLRHGLSVVALANNSDSSAKPVIAGANILTVVTAEDQGNGARISTSFRTTSVKKCMEAKYKLVEESNVLVKYGVDKYLTSAGLSVDPFFRGQGLGEEFLRIRKDIGLAYQIPVSETAFSSTTSQILARRVGFEVLVEKKYSELLDDEGKLVFPEVEAEFFKIMAKRLY